MRYQSTRNKAISISSAEAIANGLSADGGLYVPATLPVLTSAAISEMVPMRYNERAAFVLSLFLDDFSMHELNSFAAEAYRTASSSSSGDISSSEKLPDPYEPTDSNLSSGSYVPLHSSGFFHPSVAPLHRLDRSTYFLELWHGPTCAFKDMALQILPYLLSASIKRTNESRNVCILTATSGDTGKAALEGFSGVEGTKIAVFYPKGGVSEVQRLQMVTQEGNNVCVFAVEGNFDDTQAGVKRLFSDELLRAELDARGFFLSSANSINWGRLAPQIAYYVSAYCDLVASEDIKVGDKINFCVPTGNFGNILSAWYAERIGLPVNKLICASNRNDVLTQFFATGAYDRNRPFYSTISPSMDILVSSNLERLLFEVSGKNSDAMSEYMSALSNAGRYEISDIIRSELGRMFTGFCCSEDDTKRTIAETFKKRGYLIDTHTAVAFKSINDYREQSGDSTPSVVVSTASPFKFCESVLQALGVFPPANGLESTNLLSEITGCPVPPPLSELLDKKERFTGSLTVHEMRDAVRDFLYV